MKIKALIPHSINKNRISKNTKKEIKTLTREYLKEQNGYASTKNSLYNGVAIVLRGIGGVLITGAVINELPKLIDNNSSLMIAQAATGIGSLAVALSRLEVDKMATGSSSIKVKPFIKKMTKKGYTSQEELLFATKEFMNKTGGFFTFIIPNKFSSKKASRILKKAQSSP